MKCFIVKHNSKILKSSATTQPKPKAVCNCQKKQNCLVPGQCNQDGVVYQATVTSATGRVGTYVGLAKNFKRRYPKHKKNILEEGAPGKTSLSTYYWQEKNSGWDPKITWKSLGAKAALGIAMVSEWVSESVRVQKVEKSCKFNCRGCMRY